MAAYYRHGQTTMVDHIGDTGGNTAGDIVAEGVIHSDIEAGKLGAVSAFNGSVVYEITKAADTNTHSIGDVIDYDASSDAVAAAGGTDFGICVKASISGDLTVWVRNQIPTS